MASSRYCQTSPSISSLYITIKGKSLVVQYLQVEQNLSQSQEHIRMVGRHGQRSPVTLDGPLHVALDPPEAGELDVQLHRPGLLPPVLVQLALDGVDLVRQTGLLARFLPLGVRHEALEEVDDLRLGIVGMRTAILNPDLTCV